MTGQEIVNRAQRETGAVLESTDHSLDAIRGAIELIAEMGGVTEDVTQTAEALTWYPLPANALNVPMVLTAEGKLYGGYTVRDGRIAFRDAGTYTMVLRVLPPEYNDLNQEPPVHRAFHRAILEYVKGYIFCYDYSGSPEGMAAKDEAKSLIVKAMRERAKNSGPKAWRPVRRG